jgi:ABC-type proline/glycine betaine transport system permease subunit
MAHFLSECLKSTVDHLALFLLLVSIPILLATIAGAIAYVKYRNKNAAASFAEFIVQIIKSFQWIG